MVGPLLRAAVAHGADDHMERPDVALVKSLAGPGLRRTAPPHMF